MKTVTPLKYAVTVLALVALLAAGTATAQEETHGWLGVSMQELSPSLVKALQLKDGGGVLVNEVIADSPAEKAGVEDGDIIVSFAGQKIESSGDLAKAVSKTEPGQSVNLVVVRDGTRRTLKAEIGEKKRDDRMHQYRSQDDDDVWIFGGDEDHFVWKGSPGGKEWKLKNMFLHADRGYLGVHLDDLGEQLGEYFGIEDGEGALVTEIVEDSPAQKAGLQAGDVIVSFGDEKVTSSADLHGVIGETKPEQEVTVKVVRKGKKKEIKITLGEVPDRDEFSHFKMIAPHLEYRHLPKALKFHSQGAEHEIMLEHVMEDEAAEMKALSEEMAKLHDEFKDMQKELKELKKQ